MQYVRSTGRLPAAGGTKQRPNPYVAMFQQAAGTAAAAPSAAAGSVAFGSAAAAAGGGAGGSGVAFGRAAQQQGFGSGGELDGAAVETSALWGAIMEGQVALGDALLSCVYDLCIFIWQLPHCLF